MSLRMIVMVKQVPDTQNVTEKAMKEDGTVNRDALPAVFNPEDLHALEEALRIKESYGGTVTALTMGPPKAVEVLRECLYRGTDRVVLLSDRRFAGSDTLATSYVLERAIRKAGDFDLIFCGRQAIDGDTAQVGPQIAEKLGINQITGVSSVLGLQDGRITVNRLIENGHETLRAGLPLLLTLTSEANEPRPPSAKLVMAYKRVTDAGEADYSESYLHPGSENRASPLSRWDLDSVGADPERCGLSGSPTKVKKIENIVLAAREVKQIENTDEGVAALIRELVNDHILG